MAMDTVRMGRQALEEEDEAELFVTEVDHIRRPAE